MRTVKPEKIKTLRDWVSYWPKATNLDFDPATREPIVMSAEKEVAQRTQVGSFPWRREGDVLTILTQSDRYGEPAVRAARQRMERIQGKRVEFVTAAAEPLREAETALLEAWRTYEAAPQSGRAVLRREVLTAERTLRELEETLASKTLTDRALRNVDGYDTVYVPTVPLVRRGISLTAVASGDSEAELEGAPASSE
jgi:hypothetical protein